MTYPTNPSGSTRGKTWRQVLGTPATVRHVPRPDVDGQQDPASEALIAHGGGPSFDWVYTTARLDWTFESRNVGRSDGHMAHLIVTRNETGLPWTDGWTTGDEILEALMNEAMDDLDAAQREKQRAAALARTKGGAAAVPRFALGQLVATPGALAALGANGQHPLEFVRRHVQGDWGDLDAEDKRANEHALHAGARLLSAYTLRDGTTRIWIITEADRSATTLLLPADY